MFRKKTFCCSFCPCGYEAVLTLKGVPCLVHRDTIMKRYRYQEKAKVVAKIKTPKLNKMFGRPSLNPQLEGYHLVSH